MSLVSSLTYMANFLYNVEIRKKQEEIRNPLFSGALLVNNFKAHLKITQFIPSHS